MTSRCRSCGAAQIAGPVHRTHFQTCPNAADHRRREPNPATAAGKASERRTP